MTDTVIAYGICADNDDPWGVGRIRVVIDDNMVPPVRTGLNVKEYLQQLDARNTAANPVNAYVPWELGANAHSPDPYVFEPFLPKHLNIVPKVGESVKIIYYSIGNDAAQREYVAPHVSNYNKLNYDTIETGRVFTSKSSYYPKLNNLRDNGLVPDATDISLMGRLNSDVVLPENEAFLRAGHQRMSDQTKNNRLALVQASHFIQRKNVSTSKINEDQAPAKPINYVVEHLTTIGVKSTQNPLYVNTTLYIYPVEDLDTKTYASNENKEFISDLSTAEFQVFISSTKPETITAFIKDFLNSLDLKGEITLDTSGLEIFKPEKNPNLKYSVLDNRPPVNGTTPTSAYSLNLYAFRSSPFNDFSIEEVQAVVVGLSDKNTKGLRPLTKRPTKQLTQKEVEVTTNDPNFDETAVIAGADKVFLLSWFNSKAIQNKIGKYGFSQDEMYLTLQKNTEPMVKGDMLIKLILDLFDLFEKHGHVGGVDPIGSLNKDAVSKVSQIKERYGLTTPVSKDLSGGSAILNQYIRLD